MRHDIMIAISVEFDRAESLHPDWPDGLFIPLAIIGEELGEANKAALEHHFNGAPLQDLKDELIQTAAMCARMLTYLEDDYAE